MTRIQFPRWLTAGSISGRSIFDVLGSFAEFERNILIERQREGIEKAKAAGKYAHGKGGRKMSVDRNKMHALREQGVSFRKIV
ncbi:MAG: recombinase family protein [Desulfomicrobium sp.]|nr:recombinase family protein [Desulfomicrobium sp.]